MVIESSSLRRVSSVICLKYCRYGVKHYPINQLKLKLIPFSKFQKIVQVLVSRQCDSWTCYAIWLKSAVQYTLPLWTSETTPLEVTSGWTFNKRMKFCQWTGARLLNWLRLTFTHDSTRLSLSNMAAQAQPSEVLTPRKK